MPDPFVTERRRRPSLALGLLGQGLVDAGQGVGNLARDLVDPTRTNPRAQSVQQFARGVQPFLMPGTGALQGPASKIRISPAFLDPKRFSTVGRGAPPGEGFLGEKLPTTIKVRVKIGKQVFIDEIKGLNTLSS